MCTSRCSLWRASNAFFLSVCLQHVEQIEDNPFCDTIQDYLKTKTGARSVPRVFINGKFFGGGDDTVRKQSVIQFVCFVFNYLLLRSFVVSLKFVSFYS